MGHCSFLVLVRNDINCYDNATLALLFNATGCGNITEFMRVLNTNSTHAYLSWSVQCKKLTKTQSDNTLNTNMATSLKVRACVVVISHPRQVQHPLVF